MATRIQVKIVFAGDQNRYQNHDNVSGIATFSLRHGPVVIHEGFDIQIWRVITMPGIGDRFSRLRESQLVAPGQLDAVISFPFLFENVEFEHDSFHSSRVSLRYVLRVLNEDFGLLKEIEFLVGNGIVGFPLGWPGQPIMLRLDFLDSESDAESYFEVRFARNIFSLDEPVSGHAEFLIDDRSFTVVRLEMIREVFLGDGRCVERILVSDFDFDLAEIEWEIGKEFALDVSIETPPVMTSSQLVIDEFRVEYLLRLIASKQEKVFKFKGPEVEFMGGFVEADEEELDDSLDGPDYDDSSSSSSSVDSYTERIETAEAEIKFYRAAA